MSHMEKARAYVKDADAALLAGKNRLAEHFAAWSVLHTFLMHARSGPGGVSRALRYLRDYLDERAGR